MWKVLLVIASVVLGGAIFLGYTNMGAVRQEETNREAQKVTCSQSGTASLAKTNEEIAVVDTSIQMLQTEAATLQTSKNRS